MTPAFRWVFHEQTGNNNHTGDNRCHNKNNIEKDTVRGIFRNVSNRENKRQCSPGERRRNKTDGDVPVVGEPLVAGGDCRVVDKSAEETADTPDDEHDVIRQRLPECAYQQADA
ncbi:hypothetical protein OS31_41330 [Dickeya oryzae]